MITITVSHTPFCFLSPLPPSLSLLPPPLLSSSPLSYPLPPSLSSLSPSFLFLSLPLSLAHSLLSLRHSSSLPPPLFSSSSLIPLPPLFQTSIEDSWVNSQHDSVHRHSTATTPGHRGHQVFPGPGGLYYIHHEHQQESCRDCKSSLPIEIVSLHWVFI